MQTDNSELRQNLIPFFVTRREVGGGGGVLPPAGTQYNHLEDTGVAWASVTNLTIADGASIQSPAGPVILFDDTGNDLEISGCDVLIDPGGGLAAPDSTLHVHVATAGAVASVLPGITVENDDDGGISILTPADKSGVLAFGSPTSPARGWISYNHDDDAMNFGITDAEICHLDGGSSSLIMEPNVSIFIDAGGSLGVSDDVWIGLGAADGRFVFDSTPAPDQIEVTSADLNFVTAAHGIIHVDGVAAGMVLVADGTRYVPAAGAGALPIAPVAVGDTLIATAGPLWDILTTPGAAGYARVSTATTEVWDQTPEWTGNHTWTSAVSTDPNLLIENTNTDALAPVLEFYKNTVTPADGDNIGAVDFYGETSTGAKKRYAYMFAESLDVTNGDIGGGLSLRVVMDDTERRMIEISGYSGGVNEGEIVINQDGQDVDTRIEASGMPNAFTVRGSDGLVGVWTDTPDGTLHVHTASAGAVAAWANADEGVFENSGDGGISLLTPDANTSMLVFGSPSDNLGTRIRWKFDDSILTVQTLTQLDIYLAGATDFEFVPNSLNVVSGSVITMADDAWIGLGVAAGRIEFDDQAIDEVNFLDCRVGIGTAAPGEKLVVAGGTTLTFDVDSFANVAIIHSTDATSSLDVNNTAAGGDTRLYATEDIHFRTSSVDPAVTILKNGNVGIGTATPGSLTEWNFATEDLEFVDAGSAGATEQDWIEVEVAGVTGYIRVYAGK